MCGPVGVMEISGCVLEMIIGCGPAGIKGVVWRGSVGVVQGVCPEGSE